MEAINCGYLRTIGKVHECLELADVKKSDFRNISQILYSVEEQDTYKKVKLLKLDEYLVGKIRGI